MFKQYILKSDDYGWLWTVVVDYVVINIDIVESTPYVQIFLPWITLSRWLFICSIAMYLEFLSDPLLIWLKSATVFDIKLNHIFIQLKWTTVKIYWTF